MAHSIALNEIVSWFLSLHEGHYSNICERHVEILNYEQLKHVTPTGIYLPGEEKSAPTEQSWPQLAPRGMRSPWIQTCHAPLVNHKACLPSVALLTAKRVLRTLEKLTPE